MRNLGSLENLLGYTFKNQTLLQCALKHRSLGKPNNERLEFLGDSLLNFIIANKLFAEFPTATEGELTRFRAMLVNRQCLAELASGLGLPDRIELGIGEKKSGGFKRESILADALEAIFAAIYLDAAELSPLIHVIDTLYKDKIQQLSLKQLKKDPKTQLQEWLQARKRSLPVYTVITSENYGYESLFVIRCEVEGIEPIIAQGKNRRFAEQEAAQKTLEKLYDK